MVKDKEQNLVKIMAAGMDKNIGNGSILLSNSSFLPELRDMYAIAYANGYLYTIPN